MRDLRFVVAALIVLSASVLLWRVDAQGPTPGAPSNVSAVVNGSNLTVSWSAPAGGTSPIGYMLDFRVAATGPSVATVHVGAVTTFGVAIPAGTQGSFFVSVTAIGTSGAGAPSLPASFQISGGPCTGPPATIFTLRFTHVGTLLTMEWDASPGATEYIIEAGSFSGGNDIFVGSVGLNTTFRANVPATTHAFVRVYARNACGVSLGGNEIEIGATWSVSFTRFAGLNANACVANVAQGGFCSQVLRLRSSGQFEEIWSPGTPVMRVRGTMTATQFTATVECLNGAASGTLQATWNGERFIGTGTLGGSTTNMVVTPGNYDAACSP